METVYEKYRPAHHVLIEYYAYEDLRRILKIEWQQEDEKYKAVPAPAEPKIKNFKLIDLLNNEENVFVVVVDIFRVFINFNLFILLL